MSTTVDEDLRGTARRVQPELRDSARLDQAPAALLALEREMEIDAAYCAEVRHPLAEHDEWGDLASIRAAAT